MVEEKDEVQVLANGHYNRAVKLNAELGYDLGLEGDYRVLTVTMNSDQLVLFEAVSGADRYPPGRNMHVRISMEEFNRLVEAVTQFRIDQEAQEAREREVAKANNDFDPFLDLP